MRSTVKLFSGSRLRPRQARSVSSEDPTRIQSIQVGSLDTSRRPGILVPLGSRIFSRAAPCRETRRFLARGAGETCRRATSATLAIRGSRISVTPYGVTPPPRPIRPTARLAKARGSTLISIRRVNRGGRRAGKSHGAHKDAARNFAPSPFAKCFQLERFLVVAGRN